MKDRLKFLVDVAFAACIVLVLLGVVTAAVILVDEVSASFAQETQPAPPTEQLETVLYAVADDGGNTHSYGPDGKVRRDPRAVGVLFRSHADAVKVRDEWNAAMPGYTTAVIALTGRTGLPEFASTEWWGNPVPPEVR